MGDVAHHCFSQLHPELLEQMELQVRREMWVLFLLAQGGAEHSWSGCGQQKLFQKASQGPDCARNCTAVLAVLQTVIAIICWLGDQLD